MAFGTLQARHTLLLIQESGANPWNAEAHCCRKEWALTYQRVQGLGQWLPLSFYGLCLSSPEAEGYQQKAGCLNRNI